MTKTIRRDKDQYFTPDPLAFAMCRTLAAELTPKTILEPSAGAGAFVCAALDVWPHADITAIEPDPTYEVLHSGVDWHTSTFEDWCDKDGARGQHRRLRPDLVVGNPPYSMSTEHLQLILKTCPASMVAMLLPLNFLGSRCRAGMWRRLEKVMPIVPRPSFTGGKTDHCEYGMFLWGVAGIDPRSHSPIIWTK